MHIRFFVIGLLLTFPCAVAAHPVISEILWMGSDLSTSDEWVEIANPGTEAIDIGGVTLWTLNSKGVDALIVRFATGTLLDAQEAAIISNASAASSRLLLEPRVVTSAMSLPNTKLRLTLRSADGVIIDQADDGVGAPFAGANPSGGTKASMERIDLHAPGTDPLNWQTATIANGVDAGANLLATPGYLADMPFAPPDAPPDAPACSDPLAIAIYVQDGEIHAIGKTTVNLQAVALSGSISGIPCMWTFSDGYTSTSCNPPPHSFTKIGTTTVRVDAKNHCDITVTHSLDITVDPLPGSAASFTTSLAANANLVLTEALPNPAGADTGHEWVRIKNIDDRAVSLEGWSLALGTGRQSIVQLSGTIDARETKTLFSSEQKFSLTNSEGRIVLRSPDGSEKSLIVYPKADEGRVYLPDDLRALDLRARVVRVLDGDTIEIELPSEAQVLTGEQTLRVRLLGIDAPELRLDASDANLSLSAKESLRDLLEGENVDLEFDTELWDAYGRLLAYVYDAHGDMAETQLLDRGLASVIDAFPLRLAPVLHEHEQKARLLRRGIWALTSASVRSASGTLIASSSASFSSSTRAVSDDLPLRISEVYAHPQRTSVEPMAMVEWVELWNPSSLPLSLHGLALERAGKVRALPEQDLPPQSFLILDLSSLRLPLPDDGGELSLRGADGSVIDAVAFPALKEGLSFALDPHTDAYCITRRPTPLASNRCEAPLPRSAAARARAAKKKSATIAGYAAAYTNQLDENTEKMPIEIVDVDPGFWSFGSLGTTISFLIGSCLGASGLWLARWWRLL